MALSSRQQDRRHNRQLAAPMHTAGEVEMPIDRLSNLGTAMSTVFDVSERLRERGWLVPAYTFPAKRQDLSVLRIVVRSRMHEEMADQLLDFLGDQTKALEALGQPLTRVGDGPPQAFAH